MIQQLVYISTIRRPMIEPEYDQILRTSRRNNARDGITGLLVAGQTRFLQLLEGPPAAVLSTFARIREDKRHYAAVVIHGREVEERAYSHWAMGYMKGGDAPEEGSLQEIVARLIAPIADRTLQAQFTGFAEVQGKRASRLA